MQMKDPEHALTTVLYTVSAQREFTIWIVCQMFARHKLSQTYIVHAIIMFPAQLYSQKWLLLMFYVASSKGGLCSFLQITGKYPQVPPMRYSIESRRVFT